MIRFGSKQKFDSTSTQNDAGRNESMGKQDAKPGFMMRVAHLTSTFPKLTILLILVVTIGFASRLQKIQVDDEILNIVPSNHPARLLQERIEQDFGCRLCHLCAGSLPDGSANRKFLGIFG